MGGGGGGGSIVRGLDSDIFLMGDSCLAIWAAVAL